MRHVVCANRVHIEGPEPTLTGKPYDIQVCKFAALENRHKEKGDATSAMNTQTEHTKMKAMGH